MLGSSTVATEEIPVAFIVTADDQLQDSLELLAGRSGVAMRAFSDGRAFLAQSMLSTAACLIVDMDLPELNGLDLLLTCGRCEMPAICIATNASVRATADAMKAGAIEFLQKPIDEEALMNAIRQALRNSRAALARAAEVRLLHASYGLLSRREREVMHHVVAGRMNKQVAGALGISEITVKAHRGKVMRKMKAQSLPHLVNMAAVLGIGMRRNESRTPPSNVNPPESLRIAIGA